MPNSTAAGVLTAVVIGVLRMALQAGAEAAPAAHLTALPVSGHEVSLVPLTVLGGLWAGGQAGFTAAFIVHGVLRRWARSGFADYAIGGALAALVYPGVTQGLGLGAPDAGWAVEIVTGAAAGGLYRLFAGAAPAA